MFFLLTMRLTIITLSNMILSNYNYAATTFSLAEESKLHTSNSDNLCLRELNTYRTVKNNMEILKLSQKHASHKLLWWAIVLLKERKRGNSWMTSKSVTVALSGGLVVAKGGWQRCRNHKVTWLFRSTQLPFPRRVIVFLCLYNMYITYLYINSRCMYKY